ncbi:esterase/lipase [Opitutaceae bacterium TAV1]|nr:esterase/lipase [Opitutaceae bacterium TAV1]
MKNVFIFRLLPILVMSTSQAQVAHDMQAASSPVPPSGEIRVLPDVDYLGSDRAEKLDLYLPAGPVPEGGFPAVVFIHGGGFGAGSKDRVGTMANCLRLARDGVAAASIDYTLAAPQKPSWPLVIHDCKNAVRFMRVHAARHNINPGRISVMGGSAGGQLALLVAFTAGDKELEPESPWPGVPDHVRAVVNFYGGTNFATRRKTSANGEPTDVPFYATGSGLVGGKTPASNPALWAQASPVTHVRPGLPPVLTIHGKRDRAVDYHQATELADALNKAGVPNKLILLPGVGHGITFDGWQAKPMRMEKPVEVPDGINLWDEIVRFLKQ